MLPEILKVAEEYGLTFNHRTHGKKETLYKCIFCEEDSKPGKGHKYICRSTRMTKYLSVGFAGCQVAY